MVPAKSPSSFASARSNNSFVGPVRALLSHPDSGVLAVIADVRGPSYRPVGAMMAVFSESERVGSLSSGCIERDIALQAMRVRESGRPDIVRYGEGSPFLDIRLPCGGGLEVLLLPAPDEQVLTRLLQQHEARQRCTLLIDTDRGTMTLAEAGESGRSGKQLAVRIEPDILFNVFGKGLEASTFAALVQTAGYSGILLSPDDETLDAASASGIATRRIVNPNYPADLETDSRTAIVLFFHDHDWEPPLLAAALQTRAFYVGAQGSRRARDSRIKALVEMGVPKDDLERLRGPIGLISSARDSSTLAVSVLAEVLSVAMTQS